MFEDAGLIATLATAIVDGDAVNWRDATSATASDHERALLEQLRTIAWLEHRAHPDAVQLSTRRLRRATPLWWNLVTALAFVIVALGVTGLFAAIELRARSPVAYPLAITLSFALAASILIASGRETRAWHLGSVYVLTAAAFAQALLTASISPLPASMFAWAHRLYPEAFLPLAMWKFAAEFPRTERFTRFDRLSRSATTVSLWAGVALFLNGWVTSGWAVSPVGVPWEWLWRFRRAGMGTGFWLVTFALLLPALAATLWRTRASAGEERRRSIWFLSGLALGIVPVFAAGMARSSWPGLNDYLGTHSTARAAMDTIVLGALLSMPFTTAYAVLVHRLLAVRVVVHRAVRHLLARYALMALVIVPIIVPLTQIYRHRDLRIDDVLQDSKARAAGVVMLVGVALLTVRGRLLTAVDRLFVGVRIDHAKALAGVADAIGRCRTAREVAATAARRLEQDIGTHSVLLMRRVDGGVEILRGTVPPPPPVDTALWTMLEDAAVVNVAPDSALFEVLPAADREWLSRRGVSTLARVPFPGRDVAGMVGLGARPDDRVLPTADRSYVAALLATVGLALHVHWPDGGGDGLADAGLGALECRRCGIVLTDPACACGGSSDPALLPRLLAGKFEVTRRIGQGGMGVVYLGKDLRLDRPVALKTLPTVSGDAVSAMFGEARTMALVEHQNLALVYGLEIWRNTPVLVAEYLAGGTLRDTLADGPVAVPAALTLGAALADALTALHEAGILHRDIKPSNLGFTRAGTPKLLDFGVAQLMARDESGSGGGTPLYSSPESLTGKSPTVAVDLWSTAVVVLESIVGRYPFEGRRTSDVIDSLRRGTPDWVRWRHQLPSSAASVFDRALHRRIEMRFQTAADLARAFRVAAASVAETVSV